MRTWHENHQPGSGLRGLEVTFQEERRGMGVKN